MSFCYFFEDFIFSLYQRLLLVN